MQLSIKETAARLLAMEDILILCHRNPDGDTLGSGTDAGGHAQGNQRLRQIGRCGGRDGGE